MSAINQPSVNSNLQPLLVIDLWLKTAKPDQAQPTHYVAAPRLGTARRASAHACGTLSLFLNFSISAQIVHQFNLVKILLNYSFEINHFNHLALIGGLEIKWNKWAEAKYFNNPHQISRNTRNALISTTAFMYQFLMETVKLNIRRGYIYSQLINGICLELTVLCKQALPKLFFGTRLLKSIPVVWIV